MADTEAVMEAAAALGKLIAEHPAAQQMEAVLKALEDDTEAQRLAADLDRHRQAVAEKEAAGQPVEVDDKHKLRDLQQKVAGHPLLGKLQMAQMDYVDLMRKVDEKMTGG